MKNSFFYSIPFQILQECPFKCGVCNRRYELGERRLNSEQRKKMVDILVKTGLKRMTVTGGEPMVLGEELFDFLKYLRFKNIHSCLSTTGHQITYDRLIEMNNYLDQLLISIPTFNKSEWVDYFGTKNSSLIYRNAINILKWIQNTEIILEINTVLTVQNYDEIIEFGNILSSINKNIIWRIEYYYPMGINQHLKPLYYLEKEQIENKYREIETEFSHVFDGLYLSPLNRDTSPDFFITPSGDLVKTSNNEYGTTQHNILEDNISFEFKMRRPWKDYEKYCRNWSLKKPILET